MSKLSNVLGTLLMIIVLIQITPSLINNMKNIYEEMIGMRTKVGLIKINKEIYDISYYSKHFRKFFEDESIKAIMVQIDSPGGTSGSCKALFNEILSFKKENPKPVVVFSNDICASGGYYIACAGDYIVASSTALLGSIGSYVGFFKIKELAEQWKIKYNVAQSGKYKTATNPFTDITPEMNALLQSVSDDVYNQFKNDIAARRKLSLTDADKWANGKIFTGKQALALGLIDEVGSEFNAIKKLRELALIEKDKKIEWVKPRPKSTWAQLFKLEDEDGIETSFIDQIVDRVCLKIGLDNSPKAMMQ